MTTLTLHPINHGFDNDNGCPMETWEVFPAHVAGLLRHEYKFLRSEGASRRAARWHVQRMLSMIFNGLNWNAELVTSEEDHVHDGSCNCGDPACDQYDNCDLCGEASDYDYDDDEQDRWDDFYSLADG